MGSEVSRPILEHGVPEEFVAGLRRTLASLQSAEAARLTLRRVLLRCSGVPEEEVDRAFEQFRNLDSQVGRDFDWEAFLLWIFEDDGGRSQMPSMQSSSSGSSGPLQPRSGQSRSSQSSGRSVADGAAGSRPTSLQARAGAGNPSGSAAQLALGASNTTAEQSATSQNNQLAPLASTALPPSGRRFREAGVSDLTDLEIQETIGQFRECFGDVQTAEDGRWELYGILRKVYSEEEVICIFRQFGRSSHYTRGEFDWEVFLDWLLRNNPGLDLTPSTEVSEPPSNHNLRKSEAAAAATTGAPATASTAATTATTATTAAATTTAATIAATTVATTAVAAAQGTSAAPNSTAGAAATATTRAGVGNKRLSAADLGAIVSRKAPDSSKTDWTTTKWIVSLSIVLAESGHRLSLVDIVAHSLREELEPFQDEQEAPSELDAIKRMARLGSEKQDAIIENCLQSAMAMLKELLKSGLVKIQHSAGVTAKDFNSKYSADTKLTFSLSYGCLDLFFGGLERMLGRPEVPIEEALWKEHCREGHDSESDLVFTTSNYRVRSKSRIEFVFVLLGDAGIGEPLTKQDVKDCIHLLEHFDLKEEVAMVTKDAPQLLQAWQNLQAKIEKLEPLKGDKAAVSNEIPSAFAVFKEFASEHDSHTRTLLKQRGEKCKAPPEDPQMLEDPDKARISLPLVHFRLEFYAINRLLLAMGEFPLQPVELIGIRLYTGPLFQKYNAVLRSFTDVEFMVKQWREQCRDNKYTATIHVINSGFIKVSKLQEAVKVYRGVKNGVLPQSFVEANAFLIKGGIEFGFMSTTIDRTVAAQYASSGACGIIFEIQQGMIDRGASLEWASQYPHEREICFGPLSGLQVIGDRVEGSLLVVEVRLAVNMRSLTIEQVIEKRKSIIEDMCNSLSREAMDIIEALLASSPPQFKTFLQLLNKKVTERFKVFYSEEGNWYNDNGQFKACTAGAIDLGEAVASLEQALKQEGNLLQKAQIHKKLLPFNMLSRKQIADIITSDGKALLDEELDRQQLLRDDDGCRHVEVEEVFESLSKENASYTKIAKIDTTLQNFKETLKRNCENRQDNDDPAAKQLRDEAAEACGPVGAVLKENFTPEHVDAWRQVSVPFIKLLQPQLVGYCWKEDRIGPSFNHMGLRLAAVETLLQVLKLDAEVCNSELMTALTFWCIPEKDCRQIDVSKEVRVMGIQCLRYAEGAAAMEQLSHKVLKNDGSAVELRQTTASKELCLMLAQERDDEVREAIKTTLLALGPEAIIDAVPKAGEEDPDRELRDQALEGPQPRSLLEVREAIKTTLSALGPEVARKAIIDAVAKAGEEDPDRKMREQALDLVHSCIRASNSGSPGTEAAQADITKYLSNMVAKDPDQSLRLKALAAMKDLGPQAIGSEGIALLLQSAEQDRAEGVRAAALTTLGVLGPEAIGSEGIALLLQSAEQDSDVGPRLMAHAALCNLQVEVPSHFAPLLDEFRSKADWEQRRRAGEALGSLHQALGALPACSTGGLEDVSDLCQVTASSTRNRHYGRSALKGVENYWESEPGSSHWLRLAIPEGMQLQSLDFEAIEGGYNLAHIRVYGGSTPDRASMTLIAEVGSLPENEGSRASVLDEADLRRHYQQHLPAHHHRGSQADSAAAAAGAGAPESQKPQPPSLRYLHLEVKSRWRHVKVGGLQLFAAWGSAKWTF